MNNEFVTYEQALALKELGFNEPCFAWYNKNDQDYINNGYCKNSEEWLNGLHCSAPLKQQVFRWFREKHDMKVSFPYWNGFNKMIPENLGRDKYEIMIIPPNHRTISVRNSKSSIWFETPEEAELACIDKLIEIVKSKL